MITPVIRVCDVSVSFPTTRGLVRAIEGVSFDVTTGETAVLLGASGCGKTTVLRVVAGFQSPTTGQVLCNDRPVTGPGPDRVLMFQEHSLYPWLTVAGNIEFGLRARVRDHAVRQRVVEEWIDRVQLGHAARRYPSELSGGMRQRTALARSLAAGAEVILMDEPFAALDAQTRTDMQEELRRIVARENRGVLFVTHDIDEAILLGDRLLVMGTGPGRIIADIVNPLGVDRSNGIFQTPEYGALKAHVSDLIRRPRPAPAGDAKEER